MKHLNIELKARTNRHAEIRRWLRENNADFRGLDEQTDTYFQLPEGRGRLKLRQGTIENNLIHYHRSDDPAARASEVCLAPVTDPEALLNCLTLALGVRVQVKKRREIYFVENVKIHLDELDGLGQFVEIEAIAPAPDFPNDTLHAQCTFFMALFQIQPEDILAESYSDMLSRK
ncbi:MAG: class IV adenylate cyclase [Saprospiraceae bacterium]|nr:class IV adenylate cyclase [Lewinellaceae bacterium]